MTIVETHSRVTYRSLMNKSKHDLVRDYLAWLEASADWLHRYVPIFVGDVIQGFVPRSTLAERRRIAFPGKWFEVVVTQPLPKPAIAHTELPRCAFSATQIRLEWACRQNSTDGRTIWAVDCLKAETATLLPLLEGFQTFEEFFGAKVGGVLYGSNS